MCADLEAAAERAAGGGAGGDLGLGRRADVHLQLGAVEAGQRHVAEDHAVPLGHLQLVAPVLRHLPVRRQGGVCQSQNTTVSLAETHVALPLVTSPYRARSVSVSHKTTISLAETDKASPPRPPPPPVRRQVGVCQSQNTTSSLAETDEAPPHPTSLLSSPPRTAPGWCLSQNTPVSLAEIDVAPPLVISPYGARSASVSHKTQPCHWRRQP